MESSDMNCSGYFVLDDRTSDLQAEEQEERESSRVNRDGEEEFRPVRRELFVLGQIKYQLIRPEQFQ